VEIMLVKSEPKIKNPVRHTAKTAPAPHFNNRNIVNGLLKTRPKPRSWPFAKQIEGFERTVAAGDDLLQRKVKKLHFEDT
jgi:hypothetical protein